MHSTLHIHCLGLSHITAPIDLRERMAFSDDQVRAALARLGCGGHQALAELVILSTCNRIELYAVSSQDSPSALENFLYEARARETNQLHPYLYAFKDTQAIGHLFHVAAGLDSQALGEPQILGQVTHALELARGQNAAGALLNRLFQAAIHAGKRARAETAISRNPASVSSLAANLAEKAVKDLRTAQIVVLGAGEMAELAVEALRKRGVERVLIVNRTQERAQELARRWDAESATFEELGDALFRADILIASTGAPHMLIHPEMVAAAMARRPGRPLVLIDIAVPRDIDAGVEKIPCVSLYNIDNLNTQLEQSLAKRAAEVPQVEHILAQEQALFLDFLRSLEMLPLIADLRQRAESIRRVEVEKTLRHLPELSQAERARVEALSMALVKKLLIAPTQRLRAEAACPHAPEYASVARTLFDLPGEQGLCGFSGSACPISTDED